ncbi:hypothetical protein [Cognatiluteimonas profundi]|uniref:hypothetical protein n=1 Tax=Cognatiluteimonas profundi TaxID=2594501 RepID=UPI00131DF40E|nr:hypothetical protein [Lysobacter profundi]
MGKKQLGERLQQFACALPSLCAQLDGDALVDTVHRRYEAVLCATPRPLLDIAHDAMSLLMQRHGLIQARPLSEWQRELQLR